MRERISPIAAGIERFGSPYSGPQTPAETQRLVRAFLQIDGRAFDYSDPNGEVSRWTVRLYLSGGIVISITLYIPAYAGPQAGPPPLPQPLWDFYKGLRRRGDTKADSRFQKP